MLRTSAGETDRVRYDTFIIWGNGLDQADEMIEEIRASSAFEIVRIQRYRPRNIRQFVRVVYENDFVPFEHLREKTKYLLKTRPEVVVVVARNRNPREELVGEGAFRQTQCLTVKALKERIRDKYNPVRDGVRTEEHVIHGTDVEFQTDHILKVIGVPAGVGVFREPSHPLIDIPYHLDAFPPFLDFELVWIPFRYLYCTVLGGEPHAPTAQTLHIDDSPHVRFLAGETEPYVEYVRKFSGSFLLDGHHPDDFRRLAAAFSYLEPPHERSFVVTERERADRYVVLDGLHRAAIVRSLGGAGLIVAVPIERPHG